MKQINPLLTLPKMNNRSNTLRLLFANENMSRTEIASNLGVSTAAVTSIV